jgi:methylated-DNA-protein-cysteine methyltransferase-like protein
MSDLTDFQQKLVSKLEEIPEGNVVSYGQLAELVGSPGASRAVGSAMKRDFAADYPCWRVVGADGSLHESAIGGPEEQRKRLEAEGVTFKDEHTVDLDESGYTEK